MSQPEGRWMRLESVVSAEHHHKGRPAAGGHRRFRARTRNESSWVVLYPGQAGIGERILIRLAAHSGGGVQERYVQSVVVPADRRADGQSVLAVSRIPVVLRPVEEARLVSPPAPPPALTQRNPRICEECERPCRPGAGLCDTCRPAHHVTQATSN